MLKDLYRTSIMKQQAESTLENTREFEELKGMITIPYSSKTMMGTPRRWHKLFWYSWDSINKETDHDKRRLQNGRLGTCCFIDTIGRPRKGKTEMPMLPYQKFLYKILKEHKQIFIKKARGIGVTTFLLYWILYKSLTKWSHNDNARVLVVTRPRQELAEDFVSRYKDLFRERFPGIYSQLIKQSRTSATVGNVKLEAFPSHHVDAMRGYVNVRAIIVDEADYFPPGQQQQVSAVLSGYLAKPNASPTVVLCSTPASPMGLMQQIELDQHSPYYKLYLPYQLGLEGPHPIYEEKQLELARRSPDFPREYEGQYLGLIGNLIAEDALRNCQLLGEELDSIPVTQDSNKVIAIDPAYGHGSNFGIVVLEYLSKLGRYRVVLTEEHHRPHLKDMIDHIWDLKNRYGGVKHIYCDSSSPVTFQSLKQSFGEQWSESYMKLIYDSCKKYNIPLEKRMFVIPLSFGKLHKELLQNMKYFTELTDKDGKSYIAVHPRHNKLLTSLRTAQATEYSLDKTQTSFSDILDAFRLATYWIKRSNKQTKCQ